MLDKQTLACRRNGKRGGPKTPEGKAVSRHNARKHGILASCLKRHEREKLGPLLRQFRADLQPVGAVEETLVEKMAVTYLRLQRCARAEAEYHGAAWWPRGDRDDWGRLSPISELRPEHFARIARLINRYDVSLTNQFLKLLHELERLQRRRAGEDARDPAQLDIAR